MARRIDYYFSMVSPWTYLGQAEFVAIAARNGATIDYRPMPMRPIFDETGGLPLPKRHPVRQRYRLVEMQRWRHRRGLPLDLKPAYFPFDAALADGIVIALAEQGADPDPFMRKGFHATWAAGRDLADEAELSALLGESGFDAAPVIAAARSAATQAAYAANRDAALAAEVFGAPAYVLDGEVFWGQDRLDLLDEALAEGRAPFRP